MSYIAFTEEMDRQIEYYRHLANSTSPFIYTEDDFRHYLFVLGLQDLSFRILPKRTGKPYKPYYSFKGKKLMGLDGEILKDYSEGKP